jgi:hypothetical protein
MRWVKWVGLNCGDACYRSTRCWQGVQQTRMDAFRKVTASFPSMDVAWRVSPIASHSTSSRYPDIALWDSGVARLHHGVFCMMHRGFVSRECKEFLFSAVDGIGFHMSLFVTTGIELKSVTSNRRKTKSLHCPQLDHHDTDGLAGHKTWRTAQTTMRIFNIFIYETAFFMENLLFLQFYIYIQLITCIRNTKLKYRCTTCNISTSNCVRATDPL